MGDLTFTFKTITPIWTGNVEMKCDRLHETGIIGSIRWWYEALIRGLGGYACDPSCQITEKCAFDTVSFQKTRNLDNELSKICPACQMFGCTGWGRKVRWIIDDSKANCSNNGKFGTFVLKGIELKPLCDEENWLLYSVLYVINAYGTIGGKCMLKPSNNRYCVDHGNVNVNFCNFKKPFIDKERTITKLSAQKNEIEKNKVAMLQEWPNLKRFFFAQNNGLDAGKYIDLLKVDSGFLKGRKGETANKVASFRNNQKFWGYTKDEDIMFNKIENKLNELGIKKPELKTGLEVINEL
jgi:CRISPR-associated protein Cmr1